MPGSSSRPNRAALRQGFRRRRPLAPPSPRVARDDRPVHRRLEGTRPRRRNRETLHVCQSNCCAVASGAPPLRASARAASIPSGQCAPHASASSPNPALASIDAALATCAGSPEWEAQASANSGVRESETIRRAAFDQRQRLDRLHRGARKHRPQDVAARERQSAVGVDHRRRAAMRGFDAPAAGDFNDDGVVAQRALSSPRDPCLPRTACATPS